MACPRERPPHQNRAPSPRKRNATRAPSRRVAFPGRSHKEAQARIRHKMSSNVWRPPGELTMCACICICEEREIERERESVRTVRQYIMICVNECMRARMRACMYVLKCVLHNVGRWGGENQSDPNWEIGFGFGSCRARGRRGAARAPSLVRAVYCQKGRPPSTPGGQFPDRDRAMCRIAGGGNSWIAIARPARSQEGGQVPDRDRAIGLIVGGVAIHLKRYREGPE